MGTNPVSITALIDRLRAEQGRAHAEAVAAMIRAEQAERAYNSLRIYSALATGLAGILALMALAGWVR